MNSTKIKEMLAADKNKVIAVGVIVVLILAYVIYSCFFSYDLVCTYDEDGVEYEVKFKFDNDEVSYVSMYTKIEIEEDSYFAEFFTDEYFESIMEEFEDEGLKGSYKIADDYIEFSAKGSTEEFDDYDSYDDLEDLEDELEDEGYTCKK